MKLPFKREEDSDFSKSEIQAAYVREAHNPAALLQKEIDVNRAEQNLLIERIHTMNDLINDLPEFNLQYNTLLMQAQMDQIELDELKRREETIVEKMTQMKKNSHGRET